VFLCPMWSSATFLRHLCQFFNNLFHLLYWPTLQAEHYRITATITVTSPDLVLPCLLMFIITVLLLLLLLLLLLDLYISWALRPITFLKLLSHQLEFFLSPRCCPTISARLSTPVSLWRTQNEVRVDFSHCPYLQV